MKRKIYMLLAGMLLLTGCGSVEKSTTEEMTTADKTTVEKTEEMVKEEASSEEEQKVSMFETIKGDYYFSSGAGGWSTDITIREDGTFEGIYHDSDMGVTGEGYPNGTMYYCEFNGFFSEPVMKDEYTYTMHLDQLSVNTPTQGEEIKEEIRYVYSYPYGFDDASDFEVYLPGKPISELSDEFIGWSSMMYMDIKPATLQQYAIYNINGAEGFNGPPVDAPGASAIPESLSINEPMDIAGTYMGDNGKEMYLSIYSDIESDEIGNVYWEDDEEPSGYLFNMGDYIEYRPEYGDTYRIVVTDNTSEAIEFHIYSEDGIDFGAYNMMEHYMP